MTRRSLLALAGASLGSLARPARAAWDKPFPDWDADYRDRLLTDSPWAHRQTVVFDFAAPPAPASKVTADFQASNFQIELPRGMGLPRIPTTRTGGSTGRGPYPGSGPGSSGGDVARVPTRSEMFLIVRWSSALPIRQALALEQFGLNGLGSPQAKELLDEDSRQYLIEIAGFPVLSIPQGPQWLEKKLLESATISARGRKPIKAGVVTVPEHGNHLIAAVRFSRAEPFATEDELVEFTAEAGSIKIARTFKPKQMFYRGKLEM
ncbi:MAG: hypothetical protein U0Q16_37900 [Bryobacteraceae bacterium]